MKAIVNVPSNEVLAKAAYERTNADLATLEADHLIQVDLDIPIAAQTILGALPEVKALRDRIAADFKSFDFESTSWRTTRSRWSSLTLGTSWRLSRRMIWPSSRRRPMLGANA